eukprot:3355591-Alexandrium_andersonii.AAC.1
MTSGAALCVTLPLILEVRAMAWSLQKRMWASRPYLLGGRGSWVRLRASSRTRTSPACGRGRQGRLLLTRMSSGGEWPWRRSSSS